MRTPVENGLTVWLTGLSGSGKSTISNHLKNLLSNHYNVKILDGDVVRNGLNSDLTFSEKDRKENIRRIAQVAKLFAESGFIVLVAIISPFTNLRQLARDIHTKDKLSFVEVYVNSPLDVCEKRDVKGLYKLAREGKIKGIDSPYEAPIKPNLELDTSSSTIDESVNKLAEFIHSILSNGSNDNDSSDNVYIKDPKEIEEFQLFMNEEEINKHTANIDDYTSIDVDKVDLQWLQILSEGWAMPLQGFMKETEYLQTLHFNSIRVNNKLYSFSLPIVLAISEEKKKKILDQNPVIVALKYNERLVAVLTQWEIFPHRKEERCCRQFGVYSKNHPSIKMISQKSDWLIGGDIKVVGRINWDDGLDDYRLTPSEIRKIARKMNADALYAFQLRNPIHNGHVLLMKETREMLIKQGYKNPVLLLHPLGGWTKDDDVPLPTRIKQHLAVMNDGLLDPKTTLLAIFPSPMVYAGPTEVQWHCRCRIVAGANFYIVGRDPAGLPHPIYEDQNLYDPTHGSKVIQLAPALEEIKIIPFVVAAYNKVTRSMQIYDPDKKEDFLFISGTKMRAMAREGIEPPEGFMSPTGWTIMKQYYQSIKK